MVTRLTNFALRGYQGYAIDKSLIKKVFSVRKKSINKVTPGLLGGKTEVSNLRPTLQGANQYHVRLAEAIQDRKIFRYPYRLNCVRKFADKVTWWFCQCPCQLFCCWNRKGRKHAKDERIFKSGLRKLYTEIDLLEIVKQMRILRFMSSLYLGQTQRELVKFLKVYSLNRPKKPSIAAAAKRHSNRQFHMS